MFETIKDIFRPIRTTDSLFGEMRYLRQTMTWECRASFAPLNRAIEVLLYGPETGPTARQRETWRKLTAGYQDLAREVRPTVEKSAREAGVTEFRFDLAAITLPEDTDDSYEVELTFGEVSGPPQFDVRIRAGRVVDVMGPM